VKLVTVGHHAWLNWRRGSHAIASGGSRRMRGRRRRRDEANNIDTHIVANVQVRARCAYGGVPGVKSTERDAEFGRHGRAGVSGLHQVEFVAVGYQTSLDRLWRGNAVCRRCLGRRRRRSKCIADDIDADVVISI